MAIPDPVDRPVHNLHAEEIAEELVDRLNITEEKLRQEQAKRIRTNAFRRRLGAVQRRLIDERTRTMLFLLGLQERWQEFRGRLQLFLYRVREGRKTYQRWLRKAHENERAAVLRAHEAQTRERAA